MYSLYAAHVTKVNDNMSVVEPKQSSVHVFKMETWNQIQQVSLLTISLSYDTSLLPLHGKYIDHGLIVQLL